MTLGGTLGHILRGFGVIKGLGYVRNPMVLLRTTLSIKASPKSLLTFLFLGLTLVVIWGYFWGVYGGIWVCWWIFGDSMDYI